MSINPFFSSTVVVGDARSYSSNTHHQVARNCSAAESDSWRKLHARDSNSPVAARLVPSDAPCRVRHPSPFIASAANTQGDQIGDEPRYGYYDPFFRNRLDRAIAAEAAARSVADGSNAASRVPRVHTHAARRRFFGSQAISLSPPPDCMESYGSRWPVRCCRNHSAVCRRKPPATRLGHSRSD